MSKRTANCDHGTWEILPGNVIRCQYCGEEIEQEKVTDWLEHDEPVEIMNRIKPLTYKLKDLNIGTGGHHG